MLTRPHIPRIETVNDKDGFLANFWRALAADPTAVASWADWPVNEADQHAVHTWLLGQREPFTARLMGDPEYYDAKVAGRWVWGLCCWIGSGWCSGNGAWHSVDGQLVHLGDAGQGVRRQRVHLGSAGRGVHRQRIQLGNAGQETPLGAWFAALAARLRYVRVCCGDWTRILGPSVTSLQGLTGIVLDPPYGTEEDRTMGLYAEDSGTLAQDVRLWCLEHGHNQLLRIVLCGYGTTHDALLCEGWSKQTWMPTGGMGNQGNGRGRRNKHRETLWCSPACLPLAQMTLF